jgi:hypothetical protein
MQGANGELQLLELNHAQLLHASMEYLRAGWPVVPVDRIKKHPSFSGWEMGVSPEDIVKQIMDGTDGIAEICGTRSYVIDADSLLAADALEQEFPELRVAPRAQTGRGAHFRIQPVPGLGNRVNALPHLGPVDVRASRGLAVLPPTVHENGTHYQWVRDGVPIRPSAKLVQALCKKQPTVSTRKNDSTIGIGERNDQLFRLGCAWRGAGLDVAGIEKVLGAANNERCEQPISASEIAKIASSCARYSPNPDTGSELSEVASLEGHRIMRCLSHDLRSTQYGLRDILVWRDLLTGSKIHQYFPHYSVYPKAAKAVSNYVFAFSKMPRLDRLSFKNFVGLVFLVSAKRVTATFDDPELREFSVSSLLDRFYVYHILKPLNESVLPESLKDSESHYD